MILLRVSMRLKIVCYAMQPYGYNQGCYISVVSEAMLCVLQCVCVSVLMHLHVSLLTHV